MLVTAMSSGTAADGFIYPKGLYYEVDVSSGTPTLVRQGVIDPGPGVSVQMPSVAMDSQGNLGLHLDGGVEHRVRLDVGRQPRHDRGTSARSTRPRARAFFNVNFRIGDYSSVAG